MTACDRITTNLLSSYRRISERYGSQKGRKTENKHSLRLEEILQNSISSKWESLLRFNFRREALDRRNFPVKYVRSRLSSSESNEFDFFRCCCSLQLELMWFVNFEFRDSRASDVIRVISTYFLVFFSNNRQVVSPSQKFNWKIVITLRPDITDDPSLLETCHRSQNMLISTPLLRCGFDGSPKIENFMQSVSWHFHKSWREWHAKLSCLWVWRCHSWRWYFPQWRFRLTRVMFNVKLQQLKFIRVSLRTFRLAFRISPLFFLRAWFLHSNFWWLKAYYFLCFFLMESNFSRIKITMIMSMMRKTNERASAKSENLLAIARFEQKINLLHRQWLLFISGRTRKYSSDIAISHIWGAVCWCVDARD